VPISPLLASSFYSSADKTCFNLEAACRACELWAWSAMTEKRLPPAVDNSRTVSNVNGIIRMVQATIFLSPDSARLLVAGSTPVTRSGWKVSRNQDLDYLHMVGSAARFQYANGPADTQTDLRYSANGSVVSHAPRP